jgi:hypothetical protein
MHVCGLARSFLGLVVLGVGLGLSGAAGGCSTHNSVHATDAGMMMMAGSCTNPPTLQQDNFTGCSSCTMSSTATGCAGSRTLDACCAWVQSPGMTSLVRGTGLHYFSSMDATVDLACLATPAAQGTSQTVTLSGYVKLFSSGNDSAGVKIEIFEEGTNGALGAPVGTPYTTSMTDGVVTPMPTWSTKCPTQGCSLRKFKYQSVPTEKPLIIKTSDAANMGFWAELYDYNIYISNASVTAMTSDCAQPPCYNPSAVASTDIATVANIAGGFNIKPNDGVLAGEVHDCGDVRLSGATVDTDQPHESPMFYFNDNESDPLPDSQRAFQGLGTSVLGLFGAVNFAAGVPIRISATGYYKGQITLLGTYVVQVFPGAVTALSFRGRRPYQ